MQQVIRMTTGGYTGADVSAARDATGAIYLTYQQSGQQRVLRRDASGVVAPIPLIQPVTGRGQFALFGDDLVLVAWNEAEGKGVCYIQPITGYVAPAGPTAPGGVAPERAEPLPNGGQPYADNARAFGSERLTAGDPWDKFLGTDGFFAARLNKIILVQAQIQRVLKKAGLLE